MIVIVTERRLALNLYLLALAEPKGTRDNKWKILLLLSDLRVSPRRQIRERDKMDQAVKEEGATYEEIAHQLRQEILADLDRLGQRNAVANRVRELL